MLGGGILDRVGRTSATVTTVCPPGGPASNTRGGSGDKEQAGRRAAAERLLGSHPRGIIVTPGFAFGPPRLVAEEERRQTWLLGAMWAGGRLDVVARRSSPDPPDPAPSSPFMPIPPLVTHVRVRRRTGWTELPIVESNSTSDGVTQIEVTSFADCAEPPDELAAEVAIGDNVAGVNVTLRRLADPTV